MTKIIASLGNRIDMNKIVSKIAGIEDPGFCTDGSCEIPSTNNTNTNVNTSNGIPLESTDGTTFVIPKSANLYYVSQENCKKCIEAKNQQQYIEQNTDTILVNVSTPNGLAIAQALGVILTPSVVITDKGKVQQLFGFDQIVKDPDFIIDTVEGLNLQPNQLNSDNFFDTVKLVWSKPIGKIVVGTIALGFVSGFFTSKK